MTRGMILAAGRGDRMGELTKATPKPLLRIADHYLIEYAITQFKRANIREIVINISYHAEQIKSALGDGKQFDVDLVYSEEPERLETGGGIVKALPLLGDKPFVVMSSDIISDYPLTNLPKEPVGLAHLILVNNPSFHPKGDFGLNEKLIDRSATPTFTFGNIGVYRKDLFIHCKPTHFPLNQLLFPAIEQKQITGEHYQGVWYNIGTPDILQDLNLRAREDSTFRP